MLDHTAWTTFTKCERVADLGPNQIAWLKANIPGFATMKQQADRAKTEVSGCAGRAQSSETVLSPEVTTHEHD